MARRYPKTVDALVEWLGRDAKRRNRPLATAADPGGRAYLCDGYGGAQILASCPVEHAEVGPSRFNATVARRLLRRDPGLVVSDVDVADLEEIVAEALAAEPRRSSWLGRVIVSYPMALLDRPFDARVVSAWILAPAKAHGDRRIGCAGEPGMRRSKGKVTAKGRGWRSVALPLHWPGADLAEIPGVVW